MGAKSEVAGFANILLFVVIGGGVLFFIGMVAYLKWDKKGRDSRPDEK